MCCVTEIGCSSSGYSDLIGKNYVKEIKCRPDGSGRHPPICNTVHEVASSKVKLNMSHAIATKILQDIRACLFDFGYGTEETQVGQLSPYIYYCLQSEMDSVTSKLRCTRMSSPVLFCDDKLEMIIIASV